MSSQGPRATPMVTPYTELLVRHLVEAGHPRDALLAVNGIGPVKIERFGDDVLEIVRNAAPAPATR